MFHQLYSSNNLWIEWYSMMLQLDHCNSIKIRDMIQCMDSLRTIAIFVSSPFDNLLDRNSETIGSSVLVSSCFSRVRHQNPFPH